MPKGWKQGYPGKIAPEHTAIEEEKEDKAAEEVIDEEKDEEGRSWGGSRSGENKNLEVEDEKERVEETIKTLEKGKSFENNFTADEPVLVLTSA